MSEDGFFKASANSTMLDRQLAELRANIKAYQKLARKAGAEVRKRSRGRIRQQKSLTGSPFAPRANARDKRKMLLGLGKKMDVISRAGQGGGAVVSWRNPMQAFIAYRQQHGVGEEWNREKAQKIYGFPNYQVPCSYRQAQALIKAGFRQPVRSNGKSRALKRVSARWIQENLKLGQAALILHLLKTGERKRKESWRVPLPARAFLGVTEFDTTEISNLMAQAILNGIK